MTNDISMYMEKLLNVENEWDGEMGCCWPSEMGARFTVFWASRPCGPDGWLALLLIKAGDVKTNQGPPTTHKQVWICDICHKQIHRRKQISIR